MSKGQFLDPLVIRGYDKGEWVLSTDFRYQAIDGTVYTAPRYFITDLASTPWIAKPFLQGIEDRNAGVIHDYLYCENVLSRQACDELFYEMIISLGADPLRAKGMYAALRIGAGRAYNRCEGGMKVTDLAFELMNEQEAFDWKARLQPVINPETPIV